MEVKWTVAEASQLSVVLPGESSLLEMLVLTVECKAGFLTTPGTEGGQVGRGPESTPGRPTTETQRGHCPESVCPGLRWEPSVPTGARVGRKSRCPGSLHPRGVSVGGGGVTGIKTSLVQCDSPQPDAVREGQVPSSAQTLPSSGQPQGLQQAADVQKEQVRVPCSGGQGGAFHIAF